MGKISELKDREIEISQSEHRENGLKEKKKNKNKKHSLRDPRAYSAGCHILLESQMERRKCGAEKIFKEILALTKENPTQTDKRHTSTDLRSLGNSKPVVN